MSDFLETDLVRKTNDKKNNDVSSSTKSFSSASKIYVK